MWKVIIVLFAVCGCTENVFVQEGNPDAGSSNTASGGADSSTDYFDTSSSSHDSDDSSTSSEEDTSVHLETETEVSTFDSEDTIQKETETEEKATDSSTDSETQVDSDTWQRDDACTKLDAILCEANTIYKCDSWGDWNPVEMCEECDASGYCGCDRFVNNCSHLCINGKNVPRTNPVCPDGLECHRMDDNTLVCGDGPVQP
jgi:hypothetical protein